MSKDIDKEYLSRLHDALVRALEGYEQVGDIMLDPNGRAYFEIRNKFDDKHPIRVINPVDNRFSVIIPFTAAFGMVHEANGKCLLSMQAGIFEVNKQTLTDGTPVIMKTVPRLPEKSTFATIVSLVCNCISSFAEIRRMAGHEEEVRLAIYGIVGVVMKASAKTLEAMEYALRTRARPDGRNTAPVRVIRNGQPRAGAPPAPVPPPIPAHPAAVGGLQAQHAIAPAGGGVQYGQAPGLDALLQAAAGVLAGAGPQHMHALVAPAAAGAFAGPDGQAIPALVAQGEGAGGGGDGGVAGGGGGAFRIIVRAILPLPVDPNSVVDLSKDDDDEVAIIKETQVAPADNFNREEWEKAKRPRGA